VEEERMIMNERFRQRGAVFALASSLVLLAVSVPDVACA